MKVVASPFILDINMYILIVSLELSHLKTSPCLKKPQALVQSYCFDEVLVTLFCKGFYSIVSVRPLKNNR